MYLEKLKGGLVGSFSFFLPVCPVSDVELTFYRQTFGSGGCASLVPVHPSLCNKRFAYLDMVGSSFYENLLQNMHCVV